MVRSSRALFVIGIFAGSFLLFLVQPMVARLTLPIALIDIPNFGAGLEVLWVPAIILATIGPVFFLISAQAPLVQRWYSLDPEASDPYPLYAASNLGSFGGLLSYPLIIEPQLSLHMQTIIWSIGYAVLILIVASFAWVRWSGAGNQVAAQVAQASPPIPLKRVFTWMALAAIPSGMMLSTTTHLTTDTFAMPLLWVIPLGLYLLSYVPAFSEDRAFAAIFTRVAPVVLLLVGGMAMMPQSGGGLTVALGSTLMLFVISVVLHAKLFDLRPPPDQLTFFYLIMSVGGVLGGLFTALIAPLMFDWVWEHSILVLAAAILIPIGGFMAWQKRVISNVRHRRIAVALALAIGIVLATQLFAAIAEGDSAQTLLLALAITAIALAVKFSRPAFILLLLMIMVARGLVGHLNAYDDGDRTRSYFGVYNVRDQEGPAKRVLFHGTTLHGQQFLNPARSREPTAYYGRSAGVGLVLDKAVELYGPTSSVGVVGLGVGTVACYRRPDQTYRFYEIDPEVLAFSESGKFTFLADCAPDSETVIGDARIALEREAAGQFDVLVVDAFSSDAIPLHLLTQEAIDVYWRSLKEDGALLLHISNRYLALEPVLSALAEQCGCTAAIRRDREVYSEDLSQSDWIVLTRNEAVMGRILAATGAEKWEELEPPLEPALGEVWSDDYASILPIIRWNYLLGANE